ncbi:5-(carboxyamino)imidazole ribonucleotide mutase [Brucepastera parasyntrophica]|uniref:5-(carboxyamino)imidazole ribonucleotide mutase n=1 Tax=Brucepastera parasyntrophica TaxID=2880008 RepID=UPI002109F55C|nr:5-(carboxyamino)imidazole ribonucleotide mutase [Brucepastera parasyntrophica]ULQ59152.1 5-(carboxyamino)imidazole ribonucleotide mutase [Brucepastera parasyntrophica]
MKVTIFFGSKSDTDIMKKAAAVLTEFGVENESYVISAHRAGELLAETVRAAEKNGTEVFIAGAGLSAALPGVVASLTVLPVIGVPIDGGSVAGFDSLLSVVQMPKQIPVAAVGMNNAANAAYLAVEILAVKYPGLREKLLDFRQKLQDDVRANMGPFVLA